MLRKILHNFNIQKLKKKQESIKYPFLQRNSNLINKIQEHFGNNFFDSFKIISSSFLNRC